MDLKDGIGTTTTKPVDGCDPKSALTPPTSEDLENRAGSSSDLSDVEMDDEDNKDEEEITPDHYYGGGRIPVFKPTMDQFRSFKKFIDKIDKYGMKSGIVKVIPPKEWRESLPPLDEAVKTIKVKNPITQEFSGTHGTYTQANIEKQRSYNLPQWKALTEESNHQPPARRGERRRNQEVINRTRSVRTNPTTPAITDGPKRKRGRPRKRPLAEQETVSPQRADAASSPNQQTVPPTPISPKMTESTAHSAVEEVKAESIGDDITSPSKGKGRQPKSVSSRRKHNRREAADEVDEEAFKDFDYRLRNLEEYTPERCQELEVAYWKSLTFAPPMYGADMPGSLFDDSTTSWNVAKLENLLDVLGTKVPGVNTAYLYLGMWKATFAWHLEDVDLYSINYIHFGAPKQWYSISQEDARRFEAAMKSIWSNDAKNCDQFLRHKTYLISPQVLQSQFNIRVNRLVHNEGEFVITYPYGYHSGYNLGYNCAESVNFATEAWLDYGRIAKKCNCEADSVWVDVADIERKLRGEQTPEYYEESDEDDFDDDELQTNLPSPPPSLGGKPRPQPRKRKRPSGVKDATEQKTKRVRIRVKVPAKEPCVLCPNDVAFDTLLPTDNGQKAHRLCALYTPETYLLEEDGQEIVCNVASIDKARLDLKCSFCRSKRGACFQCSQKKCTRAFHATCAAAAGLQIDTGPVPTFAEDGTEYVCEGYDFRCRFHRPKRAKALDTEAMEENPIVLEYAQALKEKDVVQAQYLYGEIFAGIVVENRASERAVSIDVIPEGHRIEVEWKWLCVLNPADSQRPKPSPNARPLPSHLNNHQSVNPNNRQDGFPAIDDPFMDPNMPQKWAEFHTAPEVRNSHQAKVDLSKENQLWFYLGESSTEARAQYTEDPTVRKFNTKSNFLDSVKPASPAPAPAQRRSYPASYPTGANVHALNGAMATQRQQQQQKQSQSQPQQQVEPGEHSRSSSQAPSDHKPNKPYQYKPKANMPYTVDARSLASQRQFQVEGSRKASYTPIMQRPKQARDVNSQWPPRPVPRPSLPSPFASNTSVVQPIAIDPRLEEPQKIETPRPRPQAVMWAGQRTPEEPPSQQVAQPNHQQHHTSQRVAPVANMMGSRPSSHHTGLHRPVQGTLQVDFITHIQQYPYLRNSYLRRPKEYQSPYAANGGFSAKYMPNPPSQSASNARASQLHYQTPQQFQEQMIQENVKGAEPGLEKFERLMAQLTSAATDTEEPRDGRGHSTQTWQLPDPSSSRTPVHASGKASPVRPEYSPFSDVGPAGTPVLAGEETWS